MEFIVGFLFCVVLLYFLVIKPNKELIKETTVERDFYIGKYEKILFQKKSSEIRVGKIGENMAPFLDDWPYDPNKFRFIGNPVDGIQFNDNEIIFVEIKTGKSRLTKTQKCLKNIVMSGNVKFATFRIGENSASLHILDNDEEGECVVDDSTEED